MFLNLFMEHTDPLSKHPTEKDKSSKRQAMQTGKKSEHFLIGRKNYLLQTTHTKQKKSLWLEIDQGKPMI